MNVLYVVYWGACEPIGRSILVPPVVEQARLGARITLVTFEKPADAANVALVARVGGELSDAGVRWRPLAYHKRPKLPATLFDVAQGCTRGIAARAGTRFDIVHARTFMAGLMALAIAPAIGAPLVFHHEGFYTDEQVDAGIFAEGSAPVRIGRGLERAILRRAHGIITLSDRAREAIAPLARAHAPIAVVPTSIDVARYAREPRVPRNGAPLRFVYVGSVGGRYDLDAAARFFRAVRAERPAQLRIVTPAPHADVVAVLARAGIGPDCSSIVTVPYDEVPRELARADVGLAFHRAGISATGGSPTKVGEYWAAGVPVVIEAAGRDVDDIVRRERVGVLIDGGSGTPDAEAVGELERLLSDPSLEARCRRAAATHRDLGEACRRQMSLYEEVLRRTSGEAAASP